MTTQECNKYVYIGGEFAFRTDLDGVDFIRSELERIKVSPDEMMEVLDTYHRDDFFPVGATGEWLRESCKAFNNGLFTKGKGNEE